MRRGNRWPLKGAMLALLWFEIETREEWKRKSFRKQGVFFLPSRQINSGLHNIWFLATALIWSFNHVLYVPVGWERSWWLWVWCGGWLSSPVASPTSPSYPAQVTTSWRRGHVHTSTPTQQGPPSTAPWKWWTVPKAANTMNGFFLKTCQYSCNILFEKMLS